MPRWRLDISYDGSNYYGWQYQSNKITISGTVIDAIKNTLHYLNIAYDQIKLIGAGRTDAGVHALKQVAHTDLPHHHLLEKVDLAQLINKNLPPDITINNMELSNTNFHASLCAKNKTYVYLITMQPNNVFNNRYIYSCYAIASKLDLALLKQATNQITGRYNFHAFGTSARPNDTYIRTMYMCEVISLPKLSDTYALIFCANGFLYRMVRNLVGALLATAQRKIVPTAISDALLNTQLRIAGITTAPACGLYLTKVCYN